MSLRDHEILWRLPLGVAGAALVLGGVRHGLRPLGAGLGGGVGPALAGPESLGTHVALLVGYLVLASGLAVLAPRLPRHLELIARVGLAASALSGVVAFLGLLDGLSGSHPASLWNRAHDLGSGLVMPVLGVCLGLLALVGGLQRVLGSLAIAWVGLLGAVMHTGAGPLTLLEGDPSRAWLLRGTAVLGVWLLLAASWPVRRLRPRRLASSPSDSGSRTSPGRAPESGRR